jgi:hypothetical protein
VLLGARRGDGATDTQRIKETPPPRVMFRFFPTLGETVHRTRYVTL